MSLLMYPPTRERGPNVSVYCLKIYYKFAYRYADFPIVKLQCGFSLTMSIK